jgi:hypothetical protein
VQEKTKQIIEYVKSHPYENQRQVAEKFGLTHQRINQITMQYVGPAPLKRYCKYGHDTFEAGRATGGQCKKCYEIRAEQDRKGLKKSVNFTPKIFQCGHPRTEENTYQSINNAAEGYVAERCRTCTRKYQNEYNRKLKSS